MMAPGRRKNSTLLFQITIINSGWSATEQDNKVLVFICPGSCTLPSFVVFAEFYNFHTLFNIER